MLPNASSAHTALSRMNLSVADSGADLGSYLTAADLAAVAADVSDSMTTGGCHVGFGEVGSSELNLDQSDLVGDVDGADAYHSTYSGLSATGLFIPAYLVDAFEVFDFVKL